MSRLVSFDIGIELMYVVVVPLVWPPLVVFANTRGDGALRITAAIMTGTAVVGSVLAGTGHSPNVDAIFSDSIGLPPPWIVCMLRLAATATSLRPRHQIMGAESDDRSHTDQQGPADRAKRQSLLDRLSGIRKKHLGVLVAYSAADIVGGGSYHTSAL